MQQQVLPLQAPQAAAAGGAAELQRRAQAGNLTPLLALLLAKVGLPVVVHGVLDDSTRVTSAEIFRARAAVVGTGRSRPAASR